VSTLSRAIQEFADTIRPLSEEEMRLWKKYAPECRWATNDVMKELRIKDASSASA